MSEKEPIPQTPENQLDSARLILEKYQEILDKVDNGFDPKKIAKQYDLDSLAEILNAVGLFFGTAQAEEKMKFMNRYRVLEKAWRYKAIEREKTKE